MPNTLERIANNYRQVDQRVADAARRSGRARDSIILVAVTKYVTRDWIRPLLEAGCKHLGESRPQVLWEKSQELPADIHWHLIGHLQRNKVDRTLPIASWIHSADSQRLLKALSRAAASKATPTKVLLEVNVSGDDAKHGWAPQQMGDVVGQIADFPKLDICGLMGMSALGSGPDEARQQFAELKSLHARLKDQVPSPEKWTELSMGMSGDYEIAIEEGATLVRVGSALFDGCDEAV